jgi:hypothetical protein
MVPISDAFAAIVFTFKRYRAELAKNLRGLGAGQCDMAIKKSVPAAETRGRNSGQTRVSDAENAPRVAIGFSGDPGA